MIRIPFDAPFPVPTMIAVGVASPNAHGQEITRIEIPIERANSNPYPNSNHTITAIRAMLITTGTNTPLTLSASFAIGAFELVASSTRRTICERVVSSPTFVACILKYPDLFKVAPMTLSPICFSTGMLSPVRADSSTEEEPSITMPSTGTDSPAFTISVSPACTSSTGITTSCPSRSIVAVFGARFISLVIASEVFPFARASSVFPKVISVRIMPADSKYKSIIKLWTVIISPCPNPIPIL